MDCRVYFKKPYLSRWSLKEGVSAKRNPQATSETAAAILDGLDEFEQLRYFAQKLFQLQPDVLSRVQSLLQTSGLDLAKPFVSVHVRRGDKVREARVVPGQRNFITGEDVVRYLRSRSENITQVYVLTDDYTAVTEIQRAAPQWVVVSLSSPDSKGFNECLLPGVRAVRTGVCKCDNITMLAAASMRRKSFCFLNPAETDRDKLIPIGTQHLIKESEATIGILTDILVGTKAMVHVAAGCGSNVDKIIQLLRTGPADNAPCLQTERVCQPNVFKPSIWGINCTTSV